MRSFEPRPRLLQDFLVPHLDRRTFRDKLCWINRHRRVFRIFWRHQSSSRFCQEDSCVFMSWAKMKGLWDPHHPKRDTICKQRMRAALQKLKSLRLIQKEGESRIYQIVSPSDSENEFSSFDDISSSSLDSTNASHLTASPGLQDFQVMDWLEDEILKQQIDYLLNSWTADSPFTNFNPH